MIRMIALDLDGTLALENHGVSPATKEALTRLHHDDGVEVVIATGRRYRTTRFVIENLGFDVFAVCNGGALVKTPEQRTLHAETIDVANVAKLARAHDLSIFAQRDAHDLGGADFVIDSIPSWKEPIHQHHQNNAEWCEAADITSHESSFMVCGTFADAEPLEAFKAALQQSHPETYNVIIVPHPQTNTCYCEVSLAHVDKWHGLSKLNDHFSIDAAGVCTVGDELNDVAMITAAGHGFAMENGHDELKQIANHVCGHNERDGIVDVVSYIREFNRAHG